MTLTPRQRAELTLLANGPKPLCTGPRGRVQGTLFNKKLIIITFGEWMCRITTLGRKVLGQAT